jgi:pimeloyl-ACP methyl ester carboxylesterase
MAEQMILIHGAWLSARSWENYVSYFTGLGYDVFTPEWPRKDGDVEELREDTSELAGLGVGEIVDHYDALIRALPEPPVLIGHSFGGLFVQLLLDRGLGRAGVAIDPASPKGVLRVALSSLKAAGPAINHPSGPHDPGRDGAVELREVQALRCPHRPARVRRPVPPAHGAGRLAGDRSRDRIVARRGRRAGRRGPGCG